MDKTANIVTVFSVMTNLIAYAQALGDETRWRILQLVMDEPLCVCELTEILEMAPSSVSSHLQVIKKAGLLESEKCGKWIYYRVAADSRPYLSTLAHQFGATPGSDETLRRDAQRASLCLAARDGSCCPRPVSLTKLKPLTASAQA